MKLFRVVDVNGDTVSEYDNEADAEHIAERTDAGNHVIEIDTVEQAAPELLVAAKAALTKLLNQLPATWEGTKLGPVEEKLAAAIGYAETGVRS